MSQFFRTSSRRAAFVAVVVLLSVASTLFGVQASAGLAKSATKPAASQRANASTCNPAAAKCPEIDRASARIQLSGQLTRKTCKGEDGVTYQTLYGAWQGNETQFPPDPTDYNLNGAPGALTVSNIVWTIKMVAPFRGVLTSNIALAGEYSGILTLITQGVPSGGINIQSRGGIYAPFLPSDDPSPQDDSLVANVVFLLGVGGANGGFGENGPALPVVPNWSVVTNVFPAPAPDGTC